MRRGWPIILLAAALVTVGVFKLRESRHAAPADGADEDNGGLIVRASEPGVAKGQGGVIPVEPTQEPEPIRPSAVLPQPKSVQLASAEDRSVAPESLDEAIGLTPVTVLENMRAAFRQYQSRFRENPVGDNAEITRALNGGNPAKTIFVQAEDGLRQNSRGELIDIWGTPFFFHQLARTQMEVRSAGPDRRMWTADDLVMK
jgi:hypothetical protein